MSPRAKKTFPSRSRQFNRDRAPPGKYAEAAPRLIGYSILLLALLLIVIGSLLA